jgi:pSer/pThr/pTyr-binding forkhead associated (FHA) protein
MASALPGPREYVEVGAHGDAPLRRPGDAAAEHVLRIRVVDRFYRISLRSDEIVVGRAPPCELVVTDRAVARRHCRLEMVDGKVVVHDLMSTNGTFVDGKRVTGPTAVAIGSTIALGRVEIVVERVGRKPRPADQSS